MTMLQPKRSGLTIPTSGLAPTTHGVTYDNVFYSLDTQAGRPAALILIGQLQATTAAAALAPFEARIAEFAALDADIVVLVDLQNPQARDFVRLNAPARVVFSTAEIFHGWGFDGAQDKVAIIDRGGRVVATPSVEGVGAVEAALQAIAALPRATLRDEPSPAPVLTIPRMFSTSFCRELIAHFEASAHQFGGMASIDAQGRAVHKIDQSKKHRFDLVLGARDRYLNPVMAALATRCLPEIRKAFQVDVKHTDRVLIARYDDAGGFFKRHRDNAAANVAFRQFALSINLNDDYDGGQLEFPEYNSYRYRPTAGEGVVFSCSLLHEAKPVTRGRRYVLLTFLHDDEAQTRWLESTRTAAG